MDIEVLREMVRLAEYKRTEAFDAIERLNKYNLALIGFAGSFLSLLLTIGIDLFIVKISGAILVLTIITSLFAIRPQRILGGAPDISEDITHAHKGGTFLLSDYLLAVADVNNNAGSALQRAAALKKQQTIISACFLAFSLIVTYILYAYA